MNLLFKISEKCETAWIKEGIENGNSDCRPLTKGRQNDSNDRYTASFQQHSATSKLYKYRYSFTCKSQTGTNLSMIIFVILVVYWLYYWLFECCIDSCWHHNQSLDNWPHTQNVNSIPKVQFWTLFLIRPDRTKLTQQWRNIWNYPFHLQEGKIQGWDRDI